MAYDKRTAAKRDRQYLQHRAFEVRFGYRVGSYFKGCKHCGDTEMIPWGNREKKVWLSGYHVFRVYQPTKHGFMYWCYQCGAKDLEAWEPADSDLAYHRWLAIVSRVREYADMEVKK
jgi:hypothetical protein